MEEDDESKNFLEKREEKLGSKILYKTYSVWYGDLFGEKREHGVFLYTDGTTLILEDFERTPTLLAIPVPALKKYQEKYTKLEVRIPIKEIKKIETVTKKSAEKSIKERKDFTKPANGLNKALKKLVTMIAMDNGQIYFLEIMNKKDFKNRLMSYKEENYGSIQSL